MDKPKPTGKLKVVSVSQDREPNDLSVFATVLVEDEAGAQWEFRAACFGFDLKPHIKENVDVDSKDNKDGKDG